MNIKSSLANCAQCTLLSQDSMIANTNCEDDLSKVDIIFIFDKFLFSDFKSKIPVSTSNNRNFYELFNKYKLNKQKYLLTSLVLCDSHNIDDEDEEKINEITKNCKINTFKLLEACNPKLIVGMGGRVAEAFNFIKKGTGGITNLRGKVYDWHDFKVFLTLHPHFVEEQKNYKNIFEQDFSTMSEMVTGKKSAMQNSQLVKKMGNGIQSYNIPKHFYTNEYRLIDIQYLYSTSEVLYIFRDSNNKKIYYNYNDDYYFYKCKKGVEERKIVNANDVIAYKTNWKNKNEIDPDTTYEGDIKNTIKHSIDYHLKNKSEFLSDKLNNWFFDIEIDMQHTKAFPSALEANFPINMISVGYHGKLSIYVLDNNIDPINTDIKNVTVKVYKNEKIMMMDYIKDLKKVDPDSMSGWNVKAFDMLYIFNRLPKINIPTASFSKYGIFNVDAKYNKVDLPGIHCHCQLELYKQFSFSTKPSYKLGNVATDEIGATKVKMEYSIGEMYYKDINKLIEYNIQDTELLIKLEEKLGHINLSNELKNVCSSTLHGVTSTTGQVDPLIISYLKKQNQVVKNANYHAKKETLKGAFVLQPVPGIYSMITDFDFTSLYPSIIKTYNIGVKTFIMRFADPTLGYYMVYDKSKLPDKLEMIIDPLYANKNMIIDKDILLKQIEEDNLIFTVNGCFYNNHKDGLSEFNEIASYLLDSRKIYKGKMFDAKVANDKMLTDFFNTKQLVYKVIANSLYGVLAQKVFRFFNISLAGSITGSGQEAIKSSIIYANNKMESMQKNIDYIPPKILTKNEMFGIDMPERQPDYIITSDTDSIFCCFENFKNCDNLNNIHIWCNQIQDFLNNDIISNMIKLHNVSTENNYLNLKNELICAKGLYLSKKHYVIRVIEQEGNKVDVTLHTGIETKRADFPPKTKEFLISLINMMIGDEKIPLKTIMNYVNIQEVEFDRLLKEGDISLAKSIAFGKKLSEYKKIPQNITAMLNWNNLVYDHFRYGDRGYLYKIHGIDEDKAPEEIVLNYHKNFLSKGKTLKVIALPESEEKVPNYFILDVKLTKQFVFEDRYRNIMGPLIEVDKSNRLGMLKI